MSIFDEVNDDDGDDERNTASDDRRG